jgi:hypothetical protein
MPPMMPKISEAIAKPFVPAGAGVGCHCEPGGGYCPGGPYCCWGAP